MPASTVFDFLHLRVLHFSFSCLHPIYASRRLPGGGDDGIRTHDPLLAGQVLSQLSYTPIGVLPSSRLFLVLFFLMSFELFSALFIRIVRFLARKSLHFLIRFAYLSRSSSKIEQQLTTSVKLSYQIDRVSSICSSP